MRAVTLGAACLLVTVGFGNAAPGAAPGAAFAQEPPANAPAAAAPAERAGPVPGQTGTGAAPSSGAGGLWARDRLLGDLGGVRSRLAAGGVSFGVTETSEVFSNATGGRARGAIYEGLTQASLGIDLGRAVGLDGAMLNVSAFQIHGRGLSTNNVDNLNVVSGIEADRATRLFELWVQQTLADGRLDVKLGQQSADLEFAISQYGSLLINAGFGWSTLAALDLPAGGPAYPLGALGVRVRARPTEPLTLLLGVFNGSPSGLGSGDPQGPRNPSGTDFRLQDGVFVIGEAEYAINKADGAAGLPGTYKVGGWYNSNATTNQFFSVGGGITAAAPSASQHMARGNWSIYAVADQLIWRPTNSQGGIGVFARVAGAPDDRNEVDVFVDGGLTCQGLFAPHDIVGLGAAWAQIGARARDAAARAPTAGGFSSPRSGEIVLELSYQHQLAPWWQIQPDFQYVLDPGGGIVNPDQPASRLGNAAIFGVRTTITF